MKPADTTEDRVTFEELLESVASLLGDAKIPYMVTGSFASSMLGMPRTTRGLDVVVGGVSVMFLRAEDSILSKLEWVRQGGSLRQLEDAGGVLDVQGDAIDFAYLEFWARELDVLDLLERIRRG